MAYWSWGFVKKNRKSCSQYHTPSTRWVNEIWLKFEVTKAHEALNRNVWRTVRYGRNLNTAIGAKCWLWERHNVCHWDRTHFCELRWKLRIRNMTQAYNLLMETLSHRRRKRGVCRGSDTPTIYVGILICISP